MKRMTAGDLQANAALPKSTKERLSCEQKSEMATGVVILHRRQRTAEI